MTYKRIVLGLLVAFLIYLALAGCGGPRRLVPPKVASEIKLDYPLSAQMKKIEGEVRVAVFVSPEGRAQQSELVQSSGYAELDEAALKFTEDLAFEPGTLDGKPIGAWTKLLLRYNLTEVVFNKNKWLYDVQSLLDHADRADSSERETTLRRLYTQYIGMLNYVGNVTDVSINSYIRSVIQKETEAYWQPFWNHFAAAFVLLDDFLLRFPQSHLTEQAREDLIKSILDMEFEIRIRLLKSKRPSPHYSELMDLLESRLESLKMTQEIEREEE
ncbi:energy transducer TonB [candidate division KSB1 bacterium]|nr:energy transducer TonB [candidate division KSB1 bacterium]